MILNTIHTGHVLDVLGIMPDESVHCCVTSPPYWNLRDYGVEGQIGLEKTPQEYVAKMVDVFRQVRRVLQDDGTLWLNLGDVYAGSRSPDSSNMTTASRRRDDHPVPRSDLSIPSFKNKDMCMIPFRVAMALQADGWYLRAVCPWLKRNAMPESVKDRPTQAVEYIFLLSKSERYYYDQETTKLEASPDTHARYARGRSDHHKWADGGPGVQTIAMTFDHMRSPGVNPKARRPVSGWDNGPGSHQAASHAITKEEGRDKQGLRTADKFGHGPGWRVKQNSSFSAAVLDVVGSRARRNTDWFFDSWQGLLSNKEGDPLAFIVNPQPFRGAHFATFPPAMVEPCILSGCPPQGIVLDPFIGSGTTAIVARKLDRHFIGIELNPEYVMMARSRIEKEIGCLFV